MTSRLIPVFNGTIANETALLCNARDLHAFLGAKKAPVARITDRISGYKFVENQDYVLLSNSGRQTSGRDGHNHKDYHLILSTAKELAIVERNGRDRQIRQYSTEREEKLRSIQPAQQFTGKGIILLCCIQAQMEDTQGICKLLYPTTREPSPSYASKLYDIASETLCAMTKNRDVLPREATRLDRTSTVFERTRPMLRSLQARQFEF